MAVKPWKTSDELIATIQRKISMPLSQQLFTQQDILDFLNDTFMDTMIPSVLQSHQEYFVYLQTIPLLTNVISYAIPDRAIGMTLRDVFLADSNGNLYQMSRVKSEDRVFFQSGNGTVNTIYTYYVQGNNVVLTSNLTPVPPSNLVFAFYIRPNQLVPNDQAAFIESFQQNITIGTPTAGDTFTITSFDPTQNLTTTTIFTAVASGATGNEFNIGGSPTATATNLTTVINTSDIAVANNGNPVSPTINISFDLIQTTFSTSNSTAFTIPTTLVIGVDQTPTSFTDGALVDFLQTRPGHQIKGYDLTLSSISGTNLLFDANDLPPTNAATPNQLVVPANILIGDYICLANQCIIPQIPPELHSNLAERTSARILMAMGDQQGLQASNQMIGALEAHQRTMLDNRTEGNPIKVVNRNSILNYGKMNYRRLL